MLAFIQDLFLAHIFRLKFENEQKIDNNYIYLSIVINMLWDNEYVTIPSLEPDLLFYCINNPYLKRFTTIVLNCTYLINKQRVYSKPPPLPYTTILTLYSKQEDRWHQLWCWDGGQTW